MKLRGGVRIILVVAIAVAGMTVLMPEKTNAEGLQIRPLLYREKLQPGEVKKGFVDISNSSHTPVTLLLRAKSFRQTGNNGSLQFLDSDAIKEGIRLDLREVVLAPREAVRVYFVIDGKKLPQGDVFAAIFAATKAESNTGIAPSAQVGTLLILENGDPGPRRAAVVGLDLARVHIASTSISGTGLVRNTAPADQSTAFFPDMKISIGPGKGQTRQFEGPLVFAGNTREVRFTVPVGNRFGLFRLTLEAQGAKRDTWVFLITGFWRWLVPLSIAALVLIFLRLRKPELWRKITHSTPWFKPRHKLSILSGITAHAGSRSRRKGKGRLRIWPLPEVTGKDRAAPAKPSASLEDPKEVTPVMLSKESETHFEQAPPIMPRILNRSDAPPQQIPKMPADKSAIAAEGERTAIDVLKPKLPEDGKFAGQAKPASQVSLEPKISPINPGPKPVVQPKADVTASPKAKPAAKPKSRAQRQPKVEVKNDIQRVRRK